MGLVRRFSIECDTTSCRSVIHTSIEQRAADLPSGAAARAEARRAGWIYGRVGDICPTCQKKAAGLGIDPYFIGLV